MVATAVEVTRGAAPAAAVAVAFETDKRMSLPIAPSDGLYLNRLYFNRYSNKLIRESQQRARGKQRATEAVVAGDVDGVGVVAGDADCVGVVARVSDQGDAAVVAEGVKTTTAITAAAIESTEMRTLKNKSVTSEVATTPTSTTTVTTASSEAIEPHVLARLLEWDDCDRAATTTAHTAARERMSEFQQQVLHPFITSQERQRQPFLEWIHILRLYPLQYQPVALSVTTTAADAADVVVDDNDGATVDDVAGDGGADDCAT